MKTYLQTLIREKVEQYIKNELFEVKQTPTLNDFQNVINDCISECNDYLNQYGLSVVFNSRYDFTNFPYLAVYQNRSVKNGGRIRVGVNLPLIIDSMKRYRVRMSKLKSQIIISIWHEVGHGIMEWLRMLRRKDTQCNTFIFKSNKKMTNDLKYLNSNEEEEVEMFGAYMEGYSGYSLLNDFLSDYEEEIRILIRNI